MKINILYSVEGAQEATGQVIIVDIFRAATTAAYTFSRGANHIIPVAHRAEAFALREKHPDYILMGEHHGIKVEGFDYGNSPFELQKINLSDRIVVQRTSQGTKGLVNALQAESIFFGSFVTVSALTAHLLSIGAPEVSIVAMDGQGTEDDKFAYYLKAKLEGGDPDISPIIEYLKTHKAAKRFLDPSIPGFDKEDFDLCLSPDEFRFYLKAEKSGDHLILQKYE